MKRSLPLFVAAGGATLFVAGSALREAPEGRILTWIEAYRGGIFEALSLFLTFLNDPVGVFLVSLVVLALLVILNDRRGAFYYLLSVGGAGFLATLLKELYAKERPEGGALDLASYAFPSWHATVSAALATALFFLLRRHGWGEKRLWWLFLWPLLIGWTRIHLHLHWVSDVIAGWGVGLFMAGTAALLLQRRRDGDT